jgi:hypothetical protein
VRGECAARTYLGQVLLAQGALAEAREVVEAAVEIAAASRPALAIALGLRAEIDLADGRSAAALDAARASMEHFASIGGALEEGDVRLRLAYADALRANGFLDEARGVRAEIRAIVEERAARTPPPFRERYLAIAENARALA